MRNDSKGTRKGDVLAMNVLDVPIIQVHRNPHRIRKVNTTQQGWYEGASHRKGGKGLPELQLKAENSYNYPLRYSWATGLKSIDHQIQLPLDQCCWC